MSKIEEGNSVDLAFHHSPSKIDAVMKQKGLAFNKRLGQNFLINPAVIDKIVRLAEIENGFVLEVGAGLGVLTGALCKKAKKVVSIELDGGFYAILLQNFKHMSNVEFCNCDVLKTDLHRLIKAKFSNRLMQSGTPVKICANLPYYITTKFVANVLQTCVFVHSLVLMVQKQAALRFCAKPGSKNCSTISYLIHWYSKPEILFDVSRSNFYPVPNVDSCVMRLNLRADVLGSSVSEVNRKRFNLLNETEFFRFIHAAFSKRRKMVVAPLANFLGCSKIELVNILNKLQIDTKVRAQNLSLAQFAQLYSLVEKAGLKIRRLHG